MGTKYATSRRSRITLPPQKPKANYVHEVRIHKSEVGQAWLWERVEAVAGPIGFKTWSPNWAVVVVAFDPQEKAAELEGVLRRWRHEEEMREARKRPCPQRVRYEEAAVRQHAIIWGLATGVMREVIRVYRHERMDCSTHGMPNWAASDVILDAAPAFGRDRAREMVDAMLAWTIARHSARFWTGLQGEHTINRY